MPQLDIYVAFSQVFWFTLLFLVFYVLIVRDILPVLARSIKLRKKKVGNNSGSSLDDETNTVLAQTATTLENSLKACKRFNVPIIFVCANNNGLSIELST